MVVFGFGPQNDMVTNGEKSNVFSVPLYPTSSTTICYARYLAVFYVTNTGVELKTVIGADGLTPQEAQAALRTDN